MDELETRLGEEVTQLTGTVVEAVVVVPDHIFRMEVILLCQPTASINGFHLDEEPTITTVNEGLEGTQRLNTSDVLRFFEHHEGVGTPFCDGSSRSCFGNCFGSRHGLMRS